MPAACGDEVRLDAELVELPGGREALAGYWIIPGMPVDGAENTAGLCRMRRDSLLLQQETFPVGKLGTKVFHHEKAVLGVAMQDAGHGAGQKARDIIHVL